jgi:hypothetical protein
MLSMSQAIHEIDPDVATAHPITMENRIHDSPKAYMHRSAAWLVGGSRRSRWRWMSSDFMA